MTSGPLHCVIQPVKFRLSSQGCTCGPATAGGAWVLPRQIGLGGRRSLASNIVKCLRRKLDGDANGLRYVFTDAAGPTPSENLEPSALSSI